MYRAYEMLRDSGCIKLPTQRTLHDYMYYVSASTGFSSDVGTSDEESSSKSCGQERAVWKKW